MAATALYPVCGTRTDLLNQLADVLEQMGNLKVQVATLVSGQNTSELELLTEKLLLLRAECNTARAQLEQHRAEHGC